MDSVVSAFYGERFKNAFLEKKGEAFEDWFVTLAGHAWGSDFEAARAHGNHGDWKCDGRRVSTGTIFQCYAPISTAARRVIEKIDSDLGGAVEKWPAFIKAWTFVHNDAGGLPAPVLSHIDRKRRQYPNLEIQIWTEPNLWALFEQLTDQAKQHVFGPVPTLATVQSITFQDLEPVITALENREPDPEDDVPPPPSELKLDKNDLSREARKFLTIGRLKVRMVEAYFGKSVTIELGDRIAETFRQRYAELRGLGLTPDQILGELQKFAGVSGHPKRQAAALAVLAYFFDRCDIFEDPNDEGTEP